MNKRFVQTMLSIAALAVMAYSQNTATNKSDLLPDEDGGMVRVVLPNAGASLVIGKNATIHGPRQVSVFFGGGWAEEQTRSRQSQLTNLLGDASSGTQQEMAKSGVRGVDSRNSL